MRTIMFRVRSFGRIYYWRYVDDYQADLLIIFQLPRRYFHHHYNVIRNNYIDVQAWNVSFFFLSSQLLSAVDVMDV